MSLLRRFLLAFLLAIPIPAYAWGPKGHEVIARIAADNLSPAAHLRISQLVGGDAPALMVLDSNWADEIRADRPQTTNWHFVNIEIGSKGYNPHRDCASDDCVVAQIAHDAAALRDPRTPHAAKLDALRFLIHFVGDLHQPLHSADRHDKGGNNLVVLLNKKRTNLHHVWDEELVEALGPDVNQVAGGIEAGLSPQDKAKFASGTPADWANESFAVAAKEIYARLPPRGPVRLPRDYADREKAVVRLQLARAGIRLAMLLNQIYR
jgi:S1/P1 Nuclease